MMSEGDKSIAGMVWRRDHTLTHHSFDLLAAAYKHEETGECLRLRKNLFIQR